ncbi:MAG: hypothetical protein RLZZ01_2347 [Actinomycetota bacterium]
MDAVRRANDDVAVTGDVSDELMSTPWWTDDHMVSHGIPVVDVPLVTVGAGMGSFALTEYLRMSGLPTSAIAAIGPRSVPYETYRYLCHNSQIGDDTRIRSDSSSVMDNVWGWPGYAVREAFSDRPDGMIRPLWSVLTEPLVADYWTPRAGQVFRSIDREMPRIGWDQMYVPGLVRTIRRRMGGGYFVVNTPPAGTAPTRRVAYRCRFVHVGVGYPGLRFLPDLQAYRQAHGDYQRVVNAYEPHEHVYEELIRRPGIVVVRGSGIVGSRILARLIEDRDAHGAQTVIWHLFRNYVGGPQGPRRFRRPGRDGFAYQGFNFTRAAWGGTVKEQLAALPDAERPAFIRRIGGTNTPWRAEWQEQLDRGRAEGFYRTFAGEVTEVVPGDDRVVTRIVSKDGTRLEIEAPHIIDATGLEGTVEDHRLLRELLDHGGASKSAHGRLAVEPTFELSGSRSAPGRMYASGSITLGGPYAPVDSFLGLQYAALQICDDLASQGFVDRFGRGRSISGWLKWARNQPV